MIMASSSSSLVPVCRRRGLSRFRPALLPPCCSTSASFSSSSSRFTTLEGTALGSLDVKKSKFLAVAVGSLTSPAAAMDAIGALREADARHSCWAYRLRGGAVRYSDDGEPTGTAGRPILLAIEGEGLENVAVVVNRWFGGVKLGTGGLARAYSGAAIEAMRTGERLVVEDLVEVRIKFTSNDTGRIWSAVAQYGEVQVDCSGEIIVGIPAVKVEEMKMNLADLTSGRAVVNVVNARERSNL